MRYLALLLCLFLVACSESEAWMNTTILGGGVPAAPTGPTWGPFDFGSMPAGWTVGGGTIDWASEDIADMHSTYSTEISASSAANYDPSFNAADLYVTFWLNLSDVPTGDSYGVCQFKVSTTVLGKMWVDGDAGGGHWHLGVYVDDYITETTELAADTTYKFKFRYRVDDGNSCIAENDPWDCCTDPGVGPCRSRIDGWRWTGAAWATLITDPHDTTIGSNVDYLYFATNAAHSMWIDYVKVDTVDIASPD